MPPKTIASVLNNESNLRILEMLKKRPYYPRELAAEMKLSEPFIVRRLKAMEEFGIVEGRWETENGRKVKRYYPRDITMQLGKDGLKVTSGEARPEDDIDMRKEAAKALIYLPVIALIFFSYYAGQPIILLILFLCGFWLILNNIALYRLYHTMASITAIVLLAICMTAFVLALAIAYAHIKLSAPNEYVGIAYGLVGLLFFVSFLYHIRFSQIEWRVIKADKKELIDNLDTSSLPVKLFYFPLVIRWKVSEYFGLQ
jgi:DNA-binding transcriptional ArsR family regulator